MRRSPRWFIEQIADLMVRGAWISGRSRKKLAQEWGVPVSTVANYAAEASRLVHAAGGDELREEIKTVSLERLQTLSIKAEQAQRYGDAVRAVRVANEIAGTIQPSSTTEVKVFGWSVGVAPNQMREAVVILLDEIQAASPEVAAKVLGRLQERGLIPSTVDIESPALPAGGG